MSRFERNPQCKRLLKSVQLSFENDHSALYAATGKRELARSALSTALALYRALEMSFWLPQAEATLAQVEGK